MKEVEDFPEVSIVMLNYNGVQFLQRTIQPVLELDYSNYEFVIVDNGSTDGSLEFIKKFGKIRLIQSPRLREKNFACNYAIKSAQGEYILLLDNDILLTSKDIIKYLLEYSKNIESFGCFGLSLINENENESDFYGGFLDYFFIKHNKTGLCAEKLKQIDKIMIGFPHGAALFIKKETWLSIKGYDDHLIFGGDDMDLGMKLWLSGYKNYLFSRYVQIHIGKDSNKNNNYYNFKLKNIFYAHLYTIVKNYSSWNVIIILLLYSIFGFIKSIKQSIFRLNAGSILAFFQGYYLFIQNLSTAIGKRREIQSKRVVKEDIFLKINPPKLG